MSFLKLGRKKDKSHRAGMGDVVAPIPEQDTPGFIPLPEQNTASLTDPSVVHRLSHVSASSPDIYHEFEPINSFAETVLRAHPIPQRASTPRKPKDYKKRRGIASIFSRKKSSSLPHLPTPQGLPPLPDAAPHSDRIRYYQQPNPVEPSHPIPPSDPHYQNEHYMTDRDITPIHSIEEPYPLYSTVRTDPVSGNKVTIRNVSVNTSHMSNISAISIPSSSREIDKELVRESTPITDRDTTAEKESRVYENEVSIRGKKEGEHAHSRQTSHIAVNKTEQSSEREKNLELLTRQQQMLEINLQLQQEQLHRTNGGNELHQHNHEEKIIEDKQAKRQSRNTEHTDTDPTTYSLNHSGDIPNNILHGNKIDGIQYYFVPGVEGSGYLLPVGPNGRSPSKHTPIFSSVEYRKDENRVSRTLSSEQLVQYLQERQVELEGKLVDLREQNAQLVGQIKALCQNPVSVDSEANNDVMGEIAYLRQECDRLRDIAHESTLIKDDIEIPRKYENRKCHECVHGEKELKELKRIVYRLNVELSRYQSLYGENPLIDRALPLQQLGADNTPWLSNTSYLSPLLTAYDEQLSENNTLLRELQARELTSRPLSDELDRNKKQLQLLKEENVVISGDLHATKQELFQLKTRVKHELNQTDEKIQTFERETERFKNYKSSYKSKLEMERKCHSGKISSLKEQLYQAQSHSESQSSKLQNKLREVSTTISKKDTMIAENKATISVLEGKCSAAINSVRVLKQKVCLLEREIEVSRSNEFTAKQYLEEVVVLVERTAKERDTYAKLASKHDNTSQGIALHQLDRDDCMKKRLEKLRDTTHNHLGTGIRFGIEDDTIDQSNADEVLHLKSLLGELQREIIDLKGAKNTAEQKLDNILLSLQNNHTNSM
ncbi:Centrosomal protein of 89 kDa isoform X1 [Oopsacas minuta]|uniref:Centrosomal protein of 89 kDa isoform X1 n=1 Tax=Oopsacas minuta TaxID=111878 RepID=A0AAV7KAV4_9METZ|nr:Centrosomal protein of 89 kDa isoform X1 [Oopsacas minuta]